MKPYPNSLQEEELKKQVAHDLFPQFDCRRNLGRVDFAVAVNDPVSGPSLQFDDEPIYLCWAEAKRGVSKPLLDSLIQLVLTIGKERTFNQQLPPTFLAAFDAEKICFIQYHTVADVFFQSDFNWNVTPSNTDTKEFSQLTEMIGPQLKRGACLFYYEQDEKELRQFISLNFRTGKQQLSRIRITKNNFTAIYQKWVRAVKPTIDIDWEAAKSVGILDSDFYLADILSTEDNNAFLDKLYVLLQTDHYIFARGKSLIGSVFSQQAFFTEGGVAHRQFWNRYKRPPRKEWWDFMIGRRDLLVPQDVRERNGSYFTPQQWVELSRLYLADYLGEDWQEQYYIWDCCAGTGNMLTNLNCAERVFASTLDKADVDVMQQLRENGTLNLLPGHIFPFDFLNDPFDSAHLPAPLLSILNDPEERRKLIIYINPPYAEAGNAKQNKGTGKNKTGVSNTNNTYKKYKEQIGKACNELYSQIIYRAYKEIPESIIAEFSTLKILQGPNFARFRYNYRAKLGRIFLVPADTFDNVNGKFPIGFFIWDGKYNEEFSTIEADVFDRKGQPFTPPTKTISVDSSIPIGKWMYNYDDRDETCIGMMNSGRNDFQNQSRNYITNYMTAEKTHASILHITFNNLIPACIYLSVRHCIEATWLNDRDQFLFPNEGWKGDREFQADCLAYALFHGQNRISAADGVNHWIPFSPSEVGASEAFQSSFMHDFLHGRLTNKAQQQQLNLGVETGPTPYDGSQPIVFSPEAQAVMDAARDLFRYYHQRASNDKGHIVSASFYDLRRHFQGVKINEKKGREQMNPTSDDPQYNSLLSLLRQAQRALAQKIEPKVYHYGFLR